MNQLRTKYSRVPHMPTDLMACHDCESDVADDGRSPLMMVSSGEELWHVECGKCRRYGPNMSSRGMAAFCWRQLRERERCHPAANHAAAG